MKHVGYQNDVYDMNHGWRFCEGDFSVLPAGREHNDVYGYVKAGGAKGPAMSSFDDSRWEEVNLPHDWVRTHPFDEREALNHGYKKRGTGWYRIKFKLEEADRDKQIFLEFEGMSAEARVYFNGQMVYRNFNGYQSFCINLTDMANYGNVPNVLAVRIEAEAWEGWWYEGAGIYRPVWLLKKPAAHIAYQGQWINPVRQENGSWVAEVETTIENSGERVQYCEVYAEITGPHGRAASEKSQRISIDGFSEKKVKLNIPVGEAELWSPETPTLYSCRTFVNSCQDGAGVQQDMQTTMFGFRTFSVDPDTGFRLNGVSRKLKGFCCHQDHAGVGAAAPYAVKEFRIKKLKELGADSYRCAHNTDPEILEICDRLGMIVIEENRLFSIEQDNMLKLAELIKNARSHPSVMFYSIFNEETLQGSYKGRRMAGRLRALVNELDPTRPVMAAFNGGYMEPQGAAAALDVIGINYDQKKYDEFHKMYPDKVLVASETSSAFAVRGEWENKQETGIFGGYGNAYAPWGAEPEDAWRQVKERPFVAGNFVWTGFDYRGEPTPCRWPSVSSYFGAFDACGFRKALAYIYEALYSDNPVIRLEPHWNWQVGRGDMVNIRIITNCETAVLYLNERKLGEYTTGNGVMAEVEIPYEKGILRVEGTDKGKVLCTSQMVTAGLAKRLSLEISKDEMRCDGLDAVIVNIYAVDMQGNIVPSADNMISCSVSGGAEIAGVGNGDPRSHEPDDAEQVKLFHGCAQVILRNRGKNPVIFTAKSENLESAGVTIQINKGEVLPRVKTITQQIVEGWKIYNRLFDSLPGTGISEEANDMNSFEPVTFEGQPQSVLTGKYGKYALYRTRLDAEHIEFPVTLCFGKIRGRAWVYWGEHLAAYKEDRGESGMSVCLKETSRKELNVIVQNTDTEWNMAGVIEPAFIINT